MASIVTTAPLRSSSASSLGMATISFSPSATAACAKTRRFPPWLTNALTRWAMPLRSHPRSKLPRMLLPSTATRRPADSSTTDATQARKQRSNAAGSRRAKTRPKVSWDGMPPGRSRNVASHLCLQRPHSATCSHPSAPQTTAKIAITTRSCSLWVTWLPVRGSGRPEK
jgi:hypothetical protein